MWARPCGYLGFNLEKVISDFSSLELWENQFLLFEASAYICYSNHREEIQYFYKITSRKYFQLTWRTWKCSSKDCRVQSMWNHQQMVNDGSISPSHSFPATPDRQVVVIKDALLFQHLCEMVDRISYQHISVAKVYVQEFQRKLALYTACWKHP
jgi:hypothetical protein